MPRKAFQVQVELEIQAVTCPGVWLCPNGKISLQLYMLDSCIQSSSLHPIFPLLMHEKFIFYKTYYSAQSLSDLQKLLKKEILYAELIQWQNCDIGNVLASFETSLTELLYPSTHEGAIAGVDVDLLMEPEKNFPGIIAPKIEVSTKTTIEEKHCRNETKLCNAFVVNPKVVSSCAPQKSPLKFRQKKVCHSTGFHRKVHRKPKYDRPPFVVKKVDDDLLARKPTCLEEICKCHTTRRSKSTSKLIEKFLAQKIENQEQEEISRKTIERLYRSANTKKINPGGCQKPFIASRSRRTNQKCSCNCDHQHTLQTCAVCSKYKHYFKSSNKQEHEDGVETLELENNEDEDKCRKNKICVRKKENLCCPPCKNCKCLISEEDEINKNPTPKMCFCPAEKPSSLAGRLHERLSRTLSSCISDCPCNEDNNNNNSLSTIYEKNCPPGGDCQCGVCSSITDGVLENFDKFYKSMYKNSSCCNKSNKSGYNSDRYVTSCY